MGIISDFKAMKDVSKIKEGGTAKLSISQITGLIVNLPDAQKKLSPSEFKEVYQLFRKLRTCKTKIQMDIDGYLRQAIEIIKQFDAVAPYQKYSGGNEQEFSLLIDDLRNQEKALDTLIDECFDDGEVEEYAQHLMKESIVAIEYEDALEFSKLLHRSAFVGRKETLEKLTEFNKRIFEKMGAISYDAIVIVSYLMNVLNVKGIVSDEELENAKKISEIINNGKFSVYAKALRLYQLWYYFKDATAKSIFEMLRGSSALKEGWYKDREENRKNHENGVHISFKEYYLEFGRIMYMDFVGTPLSKFQELMKTEDYESNKIRTTLFRGQKSDDLGYGLNEYNPIVTSSEKETEDFLSRLITPDKELIFWTKEGIVIVDDINGVLDVPVNVYQLYLHGQKYTKIYICPYGRDTSYAPQNLSLADKPFPGHSGDLNKEASFQNKSIEIILALQKLDWENEELKKIRQKEELNRKQKIQEIIFGVIKKYPDTYLKEFSGLLDQPLDISSICELIHNKDKFEKRIRQNLVHNDDMCDSNYVFNFLKTTISKPSNVTPTPEEAVDLAKENEMTVEQYMAMKALENENAQILYDRQIENFKKWSKQAEELQKEYPQFFIQQEYMIEEFKTILNISDVKTAYEIIHFPELYTLSKKEELFKENSDTMFCRKCGTKIPGDSVFCYKCGEKVEK